MLAAVLLGVGTQSYIQIENAILNEGNPSPLECGVGMGFAAYQAKENEEAYRDESPGKKYQCYKGNDLHRNSLCFGLPGELTHIAGHMLHILSRSARQSC